MRKMKKSCAGNQMKNHNKYDVHTCKKDREKARRIRQRGLGIIK